jgi:hypothetical protein
MATYVPGSYTLEVTATDPSPSAQRGTDTGSLTVHPTGVDILPAYDYYQFQNGLSVALGIGIAEETDNATAFEGLDIFLDLGMANESNSSTVVNIVESVELGRALESNAAYPVSYDIYVTLGQANETDLANAVTTEILPDIVVNLGVAVEANLSALFRVTGGANVWAVIPDVVTNWTEQ